MASCHGLRRTASASAWVWLDGCGSGGWLSRVQDDTKKARASRMVLWWASAVPDVPETSPLGQSQARSAIPPTATRRDPRTQVAVAASQSDSPDRISLPSSRRRFSGIRWGRHGRRTWREYLGTAWIDPIQSRASLQGTRGDRSIGNATLFSALLSSSRLLPVLDSSEYIPELVHDYSR